MDFLRSLIIAFMTTTAIHTEDVDSVKEEDPDMAMDESDDSDLDDENELEDNVYEGDVIKVDIQKSEGDKRSYQGLILPNGLRVVLISDPETDKAAASMSVNVGFMHDFVDLPGGAHFLEHMLFMGSKKYPQEDYYHKFIDEHAGSYDGWTYEYFQSYFWDVSCDVLKETLDIMAQIFLKPLMRKSAIQKELKIVDSEFKMRALYDSYHSYQLQKSLSKPGHRHRSFGLGNKKTLETDPKLKGIDVRARLRELYKTTYSSNVMHLAVLGKEPIEDLEKIVVPLFGRIKNKRLAKPVYKDHPWGLEQLKRKVYYVPTSDIRQLKVRFPVPDGLKYYKEAPLGYLSHLLGHEAPGSILAELKERNWANGLAAGEEIIPGFEFFYVQVDLTSEALDHEDEIVALIFQYIYLLKNGGIQKEVFDEIKRSNEIAFKFKSKEVPLYYVQRVSGALVDGHPLEDVLTYHIPEVWNPSLIEDFLDYLRPNNMNVLIASKSFQNDANLEEEWYGTKYKISPIPNYLIDEMWNITKPFNKFHLPYANPYIPKTFKLYPSEENNTKFPRIIHESRISKFWFKQDDEFEAPRFIIRFNIFSPLTCLNLKNENLSVIFIRLLRETFQTRVGYTASLAEFNWSIKPIPCGIEVTLSGYTEKLSLFMEEFLFEMINFEVRSKKFEVVKDTLLRYYINSYSNQPQSNASSYLGYMLYDSGRTIDEDYASAKILQIDDIKRFMEQFFSRVFIEGLIYGNCTEKLAREVINKIENAFKLQWAVLPQEIVFPRILKLDDGTNFTYEKPHKYSENSCYYGYFQIGPDYPTLNVVLTELFSHLVHEKLFNTLRTNEQLAYVIGSGLRRDNGVLSFMIFLQSERHPAYVQSRVNVFMESLHDFLNEMTDEEFETKKTSLRKLYEEKILSQKARFERYWTEIWERRYDFERVEINKVKVLNSLKKEDITNFFKEYIHDPSTKHGKLNIYVTSQITNPKFPADDPTIKNTKIEDVVAFRSHLRYFSHTHPHMNIAPPGIQVVI